MDLTIKRKRKINFFKNELKNFDEIITHIKPNSGEIPELNGIDIYGEEIPYNGLSGGDHIIFIDFKKRYDLEARIKEALANKKTTVAENLKVNKKRAGILIADAAGHSITDSVLVAMLHQAFLTGVLYEITEHGQITTQLFEILNNRFFNSSSLSKYITLIYGEISEKGKFRFLNAGHPVPIIYSSKFDRMFEIHFKQVVNFQPIGTLPTKEDVDVLRNFTQLGYKKRYATNEINLMSKGDILLLYTDGLSEHHHKNQLYFPGLLENLLRKNKELTAREIFFRLKEDLLYFADPSDDISVVVIKKTV